MRFELRRHKKEVSSVGPVKLWYMLVAMPWIMLPVVLVLTWLFDNAALFVLLGSIWLGVVDLYCGHRIDHVTRSCISLTIMISQSRINARCQMWKPSWLFYINCRNKQKRYKIAMWDLCSGGSQYCDWGSYSFIRLDNSVSTSVLGGSLHSGYLDYVYPVPVYYPIVT